MSQRALIQRAFRAIDTAMNKTVTKKDARKPAIIKKPVAAYCRVSRNYEGLMRSIHAQISYFKGLIRSNPRWEPAGIYADEGISGTRADKRPQFQKMLKECERGKIDLILTKSISRFACNTVDLLTVVRRLKEMGVDVLL